MVAFLLIGATSPKINKNNTTQTTNLKDTSTVTTLEETTITTINTTSITNLTTVETTPVTTVAKKTSMEWIKTDGHPKYYGDISKAYEVWNNSNGIISIDKNNHLSDNTILSITANDNELIKNIYINFKNFDNASDIDLSTALDIVEEYMPNDIINQWYEFKRSYKIQPINDEDNDYYIITYGLTDEGSDAYYDKIHHYSGSIDVIISMNLDDVTVNSASIEFGIPRWMNSLKTNGYEKLNLNYEFNLPMESEENIISKETTINTIEEITTIEKSTTTTPKITEKETESQTEKEIIPITNSYVLNTSTHKFHKSSCGDIAKINAENYATFEGSRNNVIAQGYDPCGHCKP